MSKHTLWLVTVLCVGAALVASGCKDEGGEGAGEGALVGAEARNQSLNADDTGLAIEGYCPVAYLESNEAQMGERRYRYESGATFHFTSKRARDTFSAQPEKYLPAYGGWCAYAMATENRKVKSNPQAFKVIGGRAYLFQKDPTKDALALWEQGNEGELIKKADEFWNSLPAM
jgi:hypothetical protein